MSEVYQATYDAIKSRASNGDIGGAVEAAMREANLSWYADRAMAAIQEAAAEYWRPSIMLKPALTQDGDQWCVLFGENLSEGIAGFGETPDKAMRAFDNAWLSQKTSQAAIADSAKKTAADAINDVRADLAALTGEAQK